MKLKVIKTKQNLRWTLSELFVIHCGPEKATCIFISFFFFIDEKNKDFEATIVSQSVCRVWTIPATSHSGNMIDHVVSLQFIYCFFFPRSHYIAESLLKRARAFTCSLARYRIRHSIDLNVTVDGSLSFLFISFFFYIPLNYEKYLIENLLCRSNGKSDSNTDNNNIKNN